MKAPLIALSLFFITLAPVRAVDLVTPSGTFKDVKVVKVEAEAIRISHSEGTALVDFDELPPAMQEQYGWTPEKSAERKAKKEAEAKRMEEEEKALDEAPKRRAMEAAAKKKAEEEKLAAEERAKRKVENAAFDAENAKAQEDLIVAAAKARAELDRARKAGKNGAGDVPVAQVESEPAKDGAEAPTPRRNVVTPPMGTVSDLMATENPLFQNKKLWIGLGAGVVVVLILFMLPSRTKTRLPAQIHRRR